MDSHTPPSGRSAERTSLREQLQVDDKASHRLAEDEATLEPRCTAAAQPSRDRHRNHRNLRSVEAWGEQARAGWLVYNIYYTRLRLRPSPRSATRAPPADVFTELERCASTTVGRSLGTPAHPVHHAAQLLVPRLRLHSLGSIHARPPGTRLQRTWDQLHHVRPRAIRRSWCGEGNGGGDRCHEEGAASGAVCGAWLAERSSHHRFVGCG